MTVTLLLLLFSTTPWVLVTLALAIIISMITLALTSDYQLDHLSEPARDPSLDLTLDYIQARIDLDNAAWRARHR
ncbi:hypothetical protein [Corynebacterium nasicanis]